MGKLTLFYLPSCPHCRLASAYVDELKAENGRYAAIELDMIDESREKELAGSYDYWYVPCFYNGKTKLHEGHAEKADVQAVFDRFLETE